LVANLLENAVQHAPSRACASCTLEREGASWRLSVVNPAPDLTPADLTRLCEPFWRKERGRSARERSGLGLALARALAEKAGLSLTFEIAGTTLCARLSNTGTPRESGARP
jgi:signal transduction histidine kinase